MRPRFENLPTGALNDLRLQRRDLQVLALLGGDTSNEARTPARLATVLDCSVESVRRSIDRLLKLGYIELRVADHWPARRRSRHTLIPEETLKRFLAACVVAAHGERIQSIALYQAFCAWAQASGERSWSHKTLSASLLEAGMQRMQSNVMYWLDVKLSAGAAELLDSDGTSAGHTPRRAS